jgi:hypothetical protein
MCGGNDIAAGMKLVLAAVLDICTFVLAWFW